MPILFEHPNNYLVDFYLLIPISWFDTTEEEDEALIKMTGCLDAPLI